MNWLTSLAITLFIAASTPHAVAQSTCPSEVDIVMAFAQGERLFGYMGIDVEADIAYRCDGSGTNWPARYSTTADGFNFDMLARNGYFTRNMRPMDGKVMDTWTVGGNQFSMTVVE